VRHAAADAAGAEEGQAHRAASPDFNGLATISLRSLISDLNFMGVTRLFWAEFDNA